MSDTSCEWCVDGLQADGETPCPCQHTDTPDMIRLEDAQAMVEAALREAARIPLEYEPCAAPDAILALIPNSGGALERALAEAEARGYAAGVKAERERCAKGETTK